MKTPKILHYPHRALLEKTNQVKAFDSPDLQDIITTMFDMMYKASGVGLAANQIGIALQIFVTDVSENKSHKKVYINPCIEHMKAPELCQEGCLSLPGISVHIMRYTYLTVKAYNQEGQEFSENLQGLAAQAIQHEIDHLNGKTLLDRLTRIQRREILQEYNAKNSI